MFHWRFISKGRRLAEATNSARARNVLKGMKKNRPALASPEPPPFRLISEIRSHELKMRIGPHVQKKGDGTNPNSAMARMLPDWNSAPKFACLSFLILVSMPLTTMRAEEPPGEAKPERVRLENGVTLLLAPLPEAKIVAVESFYPVGFCDEPAGMTQAAHLFEHLMLQGATKSYAAGESFALLRKLGMANAETLPTFTHFDYTAPSAELGTILQIEGERLTSLKYTPELISDEADKCNEEAQFVYKNPQSGMVKHAFMVLFQFWNHGATEVRVRSGLDQIPPAKLEAFYQAQYRPDQLTIAIVGGFKEDEALAMAKEHLGTLSASKSEQKPLNWNSLPAAAHLTWDADVHAICVYAAPPAEATDRMLLSLWGTALMQKLAVRSNLRELTHMSFSSNTTWPVGDLPFFVYATAKSAGKTPEIEKAIKAALQDATKLLTSDMIQMRMFANMYAAGPVPSWNELKAQASAFAKTSGRGEDDAMTMVLLNVALQWGLRELHGSVGNEAITEERLKAVLEKALDPAKLRVVTLGPPPETVPQSEPRP